jgi:hypothetical protein
MNKTLRVALTGLLFASASGCTTYYRVEDPAGSKTYYTDHISEEDSGAIKFKDLQTGERVTLQSSAVKEVHKSDLPAGTAN